VADHGCERRVRRTRSALVSDREDENHEALKDDQTQQQLQQCHGRLMSVPRRLSTRCRPVLPRRSEAYSRPGQARTLASLVPIITASRQRRLVLTELLDGEGGHVAQPPAGFLKFWSNHHR
jgi:hypothetical protein